MQTGSNCKFSASKCQQMVGEFYFLDYGNHQKHTGKKVPFQSNIAPQQTYQAENVHGFVNVDYHLLKRRFYINTSI
jgi:hypothetical protein